MIISFNQTERQPNPVYEGRMRSSELIMKAYGSTHSKDAFLQYHGETFTILSKTHQEIISGKNVLQVTDILENDKRMGYLFPSVVTTRKVLFFPIGWGYFHFFFQGMEYTAYEVGLGKNQHYVCIHRDEQTVAMIHKDDIVHNYLDHYTVYVEDERYLLPACVFTLYFDCIVYPDVGETLGESTVNKICIKKHPDLVKKYDPAFIPKIKQMDEVTDQFEGGIPWR